MDLDPDLETLRDLMWEWDVIGLGESGRESAPEEYDGLIQLTIELINDGEDDAAVARQLIEVLALGWFGLNDVDEPPTRLLTNNLALATMFVARTREFYF
ncbi:MAG: hypothetical protein ACOH1J_04520 [Microbacteriaceae bacterium]